MRLLKGSTARDPKTQAFKIWLTMPAQETPFLPGLPATVSIDLDDAGFTTDTGLVVPLTALEAGSEANEFLVWLYRDGVVKPTPVQVGRITQEGALILNGLQQGDTIVNGSFSRLTPGMEVDIDIQRQDS